MKGFPVTGLRARQKADRNRRLTEAAVELFRDAGYDAVRIEDIAARAEVSVGTFYNYFETKGDLLVSIVMMEVEEVIEAGASVLADPPPDPAEAILRLIDGYYDHSLVYLTKEMWRRAMAISIEAPMTPFSQRYTELDRKLADQVCAMVARLQATGRLRRDVPARAVGEMLFNDLNNAFMEFVKSDEMSLDDLKGQVASHVRLLAQALSP
ncbi:TetR/AcrR family transcriptional regulator [Allitabrizicola rongguiensis]|uniref:TetR/AcrR family transcriptional regulator n=1 Tax=Alitabrizicola rongguiensis TaxID=2909234 RepID=UPI001F3A921F|nr:TetR/AcrR family transcriptional regulator [Tabrizicola rongguiensis]